MAVVRKKMAGKTRKRSATARSAPGMQRQVGNEAVKARTGLDWDGWFRWLDSQNARALDHKAIVALLSIKKNLGPWWRQMVTVAYEQARGRRAPQQKTQGFEISATKVLDVPLQDAFEAFANARKRAAWLAGVPLTVHKATPNKSLRITWSDGQKSVSVNFYSRPGDRAQVAVQHGKLSSAAAAAAMQAFWRAALTRLAGR
jgi:uncharacterized protein YndB with AHSA1/START domain